MALVTGVILLVIGLIACFFGKRLYRIVLALSGFAAGYYAAWAALVQQSDAIQLIGAVIVGLVVAFIFWSLYKFAYIVFGVFLGLALGTVLANAINLDGMLYAIVLVVAAVIGAIVGRQLADVIIRFATAFSGASQIVSGLGGIGAAIRLSLPLIDPAHTATTATDSLTALITAAFVIFLGIVGYLYQTRNDPDAR